MILLNILIYVRKPHSILHSKIKITPYLSVLFAICVQRMS
nr:MAG TPA: hypothetical protein [Caudoviricetes sp.]